MELGRFGKVGRWCVLALEPHGDTKPILSTVHGLCPVARWGEKNSHGRRYGTEGVKPRPVSWDGVPNVGTSQRGRSWMPDRCSEQSSIRLGAADLRHFRSE
jgi:hypothetical protein